ncbi:MAG: 3-isopropylmalate dehydratase small subunit [Betaproteobacteria bacterium]|nr:MAG: 3-isopropylmalate dehydratase small subunit [Betaproteobacteria bacterium]TAG46512.1 MAG: 3-isopropylmalate dehydratase small subunit [Betaproteobacteria bacterium]
MERFTVHTGLVAPLDRANVDTDAIIPKQFLKSIKRSGYGPNCFDEWRYLDVGQPGADNSKRPLNSQFILNEPRYAGASVLLARQNFGCGSSREHAPWALLQNGYRAIIAPSYGDIFHSNSLNNGLLVIRLPEAQVDQLFHDCAAFPGFQLVIDLELQQVRATDARYAFDFEIAAGKRERMLNGWDDIGLTLKHSAEIAAFESKHLAAQPWLA